MKSRIIKVVTFLGGIYFFMEFMLPKHIFIGETSFEFGKHRTDIYNGYLIVFSMAIGLGVVNLVRIHGRALLRGGKNWFYSLVLLVSMFGTIILGLWGTSSGASEGVSEFFWGFLYNGVYNSLARAMFSLLAFYIAFAAYRSFRVQNMEAGLMMTAALIVMLGQIPLGYFIWEQIPVIRGWVMTRVNVPVFRGIYFGAGVAGLAMAVRMWLPLDRRVGGQ